MAKYFQCAMVVALIAAGTAEPPRRFNSRLQNRNRFFARQEESPTAVTPYPPAGIKPEIPFELPNQEAASFPEPTYGPPDQTYGPPEQTYGPPDQTYGPPDQTYGPPQTKEASPAAEDFDEQATDEPEAERLIFTRRNPNQRLVQQTRRKPQAAALKRPITFRKSAAIRQPARLQAPTLVSRPVRFRDGSLVYSIQL